MSTPTFCAPGVIIKEGSASDRVGNTNVLVVSCTGLAVSLIWLIFSKQLWMLYVFAIFFSFAYGGEITLMPLLIGQFFGLQAIMALTGALGMGARFGGALGSWMGGKLFDITRSYLVAFVSIAIAGVLVAIIALMLREARRPTKS